MHLIGEKSIQGDSNISIDLPQNETIDRKLRISAFGELKSGEITRYLILRINKIDKGYYSYVDVGGDEREGEWGHKQDEVKDRGIYVGRNGGYLGRFDASFTLDYTLAVNSKSKRIVGNGTSTFGDIGNRTYGCQSHGFLESREPIPLKNIELIFSGGIATWTCRIYAY
ncbi:MULTISPECIES: hypothetical protein [unclassified Paenibacillus]|uniref:hypothetical protein n=1 Tax=unclassified Paenibacillus TaxID=185978 RepID=UPI00096C8967|nr:hypothetical protein [Paenibacillus sp. FSL H8-0259]OMF30992.1 hypothetical protein BK132_06060 [Paenibacillus sp. FSL H8-0259]